jgi:hypothetical protein
MFNDIAGNWEQSYIHILASNGIISGYGDGTFKPDGNITRAEMIQIILDSAK